MDSAIKLYPWQEQAVTRLRPGNILYGQVGSGKTLAALAFYQRKFNDRPLIVITTAKKRDTHDWETEASSLGIEKIIVDSWNNIEKYKFHYDSFFIFDEQRVVGYGKWAKTFIAIAKLNTWILLSGTPGDKWTDYIPVFIANGFYRNKSDFEEQHVEYDRFAKFPLIKAFHNQSKLVSERNLVLVAMPFKRNTHRNKVIIRTKFDKDEYKRFTISRVNPYDDQPIENPSKFTQIARKLVATHEDRIAKAANLIRTIPRSIVFYNYEYERQILINICHHEHKSFAQWNGHVHESLPTSDNWAYLVQYTAGSEGWNCTSTDSIIFYSPNYSYKVIEQSEGRIDRVNTNYKELYYYWLVSPSMIDNAVLMSIEKKKKFNAAGWANSLLGLHRHGG